MELQRRKTMNPLREIFYWQDHKKREVDFVVKEGERIKELVQIGGVIDDFSTKKREITALLKAPEELKCNVLLVITLSYENEEKINGKRINFKPLWKWLIEKNTTSLPA